MKRLRTISEDEFVAVFLMSEFDSPRFGDRVRALLAEQDADPAIVLRPDLTSRADNRYRQELLGALRGYKREIQLLRLFPDAVLWERALFSASELREVRYINYDYWLELSGGTRMPADGAARVRQGIQVFGKGTDSFWRVAEAVRRGVPFREMILVSHDGVRWVVIEGHVRLTAFMLEPDFVPDEMEVIAGRSERMTDWPLY